VIITKLEENYQNNLQLFKRYIPSIFKLLEENEDNSYAIEVNNVDINISKNGNLLYPNDTKQYFNNLLQNYTENIKESVVNCNIRLAKSDNSLKRFGVGTIHKKRLSDVSQNYKNIFHTFPFEKTEGLKQNFLYMGIIYGIGLGYHIMPLIKKYKFRHLYLVDISIEMLRSSLYTIDWSEIFQYFLEDTTKSFSIIVQKDEDFNKLSKIILKKLSEYNPLGYFNLANFISYDDKNLEQIKSEVNNLMHLLFRHRGFFDDEIWGLQHSIHNLKEDIPILTNSSIKVDKNKFVFIVGNGPSLDNYIDVIKKYRDRAIVIASGTAINSLYKYNIIPDIYLAMERTIADQESVSYLPKKYLKKIIFVGMNTIHPRLFAQFKQKYMFFKTQDTGTSLINSEKYVILNYSNPTVTNASLSFSIFVGFKNICLFGMDFGYKDLKNHHSEKSIYLDNLTLFSKKVFKNEVKVEGVDGDIIYTQESYNNSRKIIEELIENSPSDINIYNFSNGAKIKGTKRVINPKDIKLHKQEISKKKVLKSIKKQFILNQQDIKIDYKTFIKKVDILENLIRRYDNKNISKYELLKFFDIFYLSFQNEFKDSNLKYMKILLKGSIEAIISNIYTFISTKEYNKEVQKFIQISFNTFIEFLEDVKSKFLDIEKYIDSPFKWKE